VNPQWVHLQVGNDFWLDVARFEDAVSSTKGVTGERLTQEQVTRLREAVLLYAGDLLEGCYQEWCLFERERLQNLYLVALDKLVSYCEVKQLFEEGLSYGTTILRYDRARERTHWQMMRLHYLAGDRTGALRQYERCVQALHQELGVEPSRQTNALYEHIRDDRLRSNDPGPVYFDTGENKPIEGQILGHLKRLAGIMVESQRQAHEELATLETVLGLGTRLQTPEVRRQSRTTTRPS
jgi:DNA-binding SARP family transcriptional activator